ncbi:MAG: type II secretion system major pseudopilin GspG [Planctomycetota bacterium]|nr:MAG: type II secretion system major pseudopilin GspG [Planctomycetota bacterium]
MQVVMKNRNRRRGFTLLEVLLVVGIIALLAAFVVPSFIGTEKSAKIKLAEGMVGTGGTLATQLELYRMAMGTYPDELKGLVEKPDDEDEEAKWGGPYITDPKSLRDPWANELQYKFPGEVREDSYDLWSMGPDGEDGTDDDIKNWTSED